MNSAPVRLLKKKLLAELRGGDFTHPGNADILATVMSGINASKKNCILDVGSGLGGTANLLKGYGEVVGVDIDQAVLEYARHTYTDINFVETDVQNLHTVFPENHFNTIVMLSSFYAFDNQQLACEALAKISQNNSK